MPGNALGPIDTGRLILVPVTLENLRVLWHVMRSPDLREYQDIPRVPFERFADRLQKRSAHLGRGAVGRFEWLVTLPSEADPIGWVSIRFQDRHRHRGELGYSILTPWRRQGFGSEAVRALISLAFTSDVVDTVEAYCMPTNSGSLAVMKRAGLGERERMRRGAMVRGIPVDVVRFDISRAQWLHAVAGAERLQDWPMASDKAVVLQLAKEQDPDR